MTYAHIINGVVFEKFTPPEGVSIEDCFHDALTWVDVSSLSPAPQVGWVATKAGNVWTFSVPPAAAALTLAQQASAALGGAVTLTLNGSMTLAATPFPADTEAQTKMSAVVTTLLATGAFPGGASSYPLRDAAGVWHTFTAAQYKSVAGAIASYVGALMLIAEGNPLSATALPASSATITV